MTWDLQTEQVLDVCMDTFGVGKTGTFIYCPKDGASYPVRGIFDNARQLVTPNTHSGVSSVHPVLGIKLSDLPSPPMNGDKALVENVYYRILEVMKDTQGGATLVLQKT